jgi:hypothetical protein
MSSVVLSTLWHVTVVINSEIIESIIAERNPTEFGKSREDPAERPLH